MKNEGFLEDINNNILSSGVVPNLFGKDEIPGIIDAVRKPALQAGCDETTDALWKFFIDRVRSNLHVVMLAVSPIRDSLRSPLQDVSRIGELYDHRLVSYLAIRSAAGRKWL
jgi:dynein heavy chain